MTTFFASNSYAKLCLPYYARSLHRRIRIPHKYRTPVKPGYFENLKNLRIDTAQLELAVSLIYFLAYPISSPSIADERNFTFSKFNTILGTSALLDYRHNRMLQCHNFCFFENFFV